MTRSLRSWRRAISVYVVRPAGPADIPAVIELTKLWAAEPSTTGHYLVARLFEEAAARGIHRHIMISMNTDWPCTLRFYEKHGFRPWFFTMFTGTSTEEGSEAKCRHAKKKPRCSGAQCKKS
jgi:hypothetical protein